MIKKGRAAQLARLQDGRISYDLLQEAHAFSCIALKHLSGNLKHLVI